MIDNLSIPSQKNYVPGSFLAGQRENQVLREEKVRTIISAGRSLQVRINVSLHIGHPSVLWKKDLHLLQIFITCKY